MASKICIECPNCGARLGVVAAPGIRNKRLTCAKCGVTNDFNAYKIIPSGSQPPASGQSTPQYPRQPGQLQYQQPAQPPVRQQYQQQPSQRQQPTQRPPQYQQSPQYQQPAQQPLQQTAQQPAKTIQTTPNPAYVQGAQVQTAGQPINQKRIDLANRVRQKVAQNPNNAIHRQPQQQQAPQQPTRQPASNYQQPANQPVFGSTSYNPELLNQYRERQQPAQQQYPPQQQSRQQQYPLQQQQYQQQQQQYPQQQYPWQQQYQQQQQYPGDNHNTVISGVNMLNPTQLDFPGMLIINNCMYQLKPGRNIVGRDCATATADIRIACPSKRMSREHLCIDVERRGDVYVHIASLCKANVNPTRIGNATLIYGDSIPLTSGAQIHLPDCDIRFVSRNFDNTTFDPNSIR